MSTPLINTGQLTLYIKPCLPLSLLFLFYNTSLPKRPTVFSSIL